jgi:hypothetical protein
MGAGLEYVLSICYLGNGIVLAGTGVSTGDGDIYRSTDFGITWSPIEMGAGLEYVMSLCYLGNGIVLAGSGVGTGDGDIYRSAVASVADPVVIPQQCKVVTVSTTGTIANTTGLEVITGAGTITRTLPAANALGVGNCYKIVVKNMSSTACTLSRGGANLLIGFAGVTNITSVPLAVGQSVILESNSADTWFIIG